MANLHKLRARIKSMNSTRKITKVQELITISRVTKTQRRVTDSQPYADETEKVIERLASASSLGHPMLVKREGNQRVAVLIVTNDRGMCGGYNHNVLKKAARLRIVLEEQGHGVVPYVTGRKGTDYYDFRGVEPVGMWKGFSQDPNYAAAHGVRRHLIDGLSATTEGIAEYREGLRGTSGETVQGFDQVHVVYAEFVSVLSQIPRVHQMLPIEPVYEDVEIAQGKDVLSDGSDDLKPDYELKPGADALLVELLPRYVSRTLFTVMLEAAAPESAVRRSAMKSATDNTTELVKDLSRVANQARQTQITQGIIEIVDSAGALSDGGESDQI